MRGRRETLLCGERGARDQGKAENQRRNLGPDLCAHAIFPSNVASPPARVRTSSW